MVVRGAEPSSTGSTAFKPAESTISASNSVPDDNFAESLDLSEGLFSYMYRGFTQAAAYLSPLLRASLNTSSHITRVATSRPESSLSPSPTSFSLLSLTQTRGMSSQIETHTKSTPSSTSTDSNESPKPVLGLPSPDDVQNAPQLDISGEGSTIRFDHLGPIVVNQDGSLSRISNWDQMTETEKKNTLRVLVKRNNQRLAALKVQDVQAGETVDQ